MQITRECSAILQTEPVGQKPLPVPHSCCALRSETLGMFLGQPRVEPLVDGQLLLAVLMVSDSPPARILDWISRGRNMFGTSTSIVVWFEAARSPRTMRCSRRCTE